MSCTVCASASTRQGELYDDRYGYPGYYDIYLCSSCGHRFIAADFTAAQLAELYTDYYPRSTLDLASFRPAQAPHGFRAWLDGVSRSAYCWVPERVRILDIGCGFGETLAYHKARGCEVFGVEADGNIRRVAERFGFEVHVGLFDADLYEPESFDYVTLDQVIEHMTDPATALRGVARILKPGGVAILSTPNAGGWGARVFGRRWINWHVPYHLQHFSLNSMGIAAEKAGFSIERTMTLTSSEWLHYQWIHALTFPGLGEPSPFWSLKGKKGVQNWLIMRFLGLIRHTKMNHVVTRLFDMLGMGDNRLFFLVKK